MKVDEGRLKLTFVGMSVIISCEQFEWKMALNTGSTMGDGSVRSHLLSVFPLRRYLFNFPYSNVGTSFYTDYLNLKIYLQCQGRSQDFSVGTHSFPSHLFTPPTPQKKDQSHFRFTCLLFQIACARVLIEYRLTYFSVFFFFLFFYLFFYFIYLFIYLFFIIIFRYAIAYLRTGSYAPECTPWNTVHKPDLTRSGMTTCSSRRDKVSTWFEVLFVVEG